MLTGSREFLPGRKALHILSCAQLAVARGENEPRTGDVPHAIMRNMQHDPGQRAETPPEHRFDKPISGIRAGAPSSVMDSQTVRRAIGAINGRTTECKVRTFSR
jgi:hypothetical protein